MVCVGMESVQKRRVQQKVEEELLAGGGPLQGGTQHSAAHT